MRLFIALPVPQTARNELRSAMHRVGRYDTMRLTSPEGYHMTLAFLGERSSDDLPGIFQAVDAAAGEFSPFLVHLCRACTLSRGAVLAAAAGSGSAQAAALMRRMQQLLGLDQAKGSHTPHITLARMRRGKGRVPERILQSADQQIDMMLRCDRIVVYRSILQRTQAVYEQLYERRFSV